MKKLTFIAILLLFSFSFSKAQIINTIAGNHLGGCNGDGGQATTAELESSSGVVFDASGNMYFGDEGCNVIREISSIGTVNLLAGNYSSGFSGDGGQATAAELFFPMGIALDPSGNLYVADQYNNVIREIYSFGIINTVAGNYSYGHGYSGDGGPAIDAELFYPLGVALDANNNLYIADYGNSVIRKVNTSGIISTIAGTNVRGYTGDGGSATAAEMYYPYDISIDNFGNIFIADYGNNVIREVNTSGIISTVAGNYSYGPGFSGDGGQATAAELNSPVTVRLDIHNNFYISDKGNNVIRMVNTSGIITTVAGNYSYGTGYSGDGGPATNAELRTPWGVGFDASDNMYITDAGNYVIRGVPNITTGYKQPSNSPNLLIYPNPAQNEIYVQLNGNEKAELIDIYSITGQKLLEQKLNTQYSLLNTSTMPNGIYFLKVQMQDGGSVVKKVEILR